MHTAAVNVCSFALFLFLRLFISSSFFLYSIETTKSLFSTDSWAASNLKGLNYLRLEINLNDSVRCFVFFVRLVRSLAGCCRLSSWFHCQFSIYVLVVSCSCKSPSHSRTCGIRWFYLVCRTNLSVDLLNCEQKYSEIIVVLHLMVCRRCAHRRNSTQLHTLCFPFSLPQCVYVWH